MRFTIHISVLLIVFILQFVNVCPSQEINVVQYTIVDGLPQSQVNKILFDSRGILWIATSGGGVSSFDGVNFTTFDESNGLGGNIVLDLEEDSQGRIMCVSSWGGISVINNNRVEKIIPIVEGLNMISAIEKDSYGIIWLVGNKVCYLKNDIIIPIVTDVNLPFVNNPNLRSYEDEMLITGTGKNGLYYEQNGQTEKINLPFSEFSNEISITDFLVESANKLWITSRNGIYCLEDGEIIKYAEEEGIGAYELTSACFDSQGNVWFGSKGEGIIGMVNTPFSFYSRVPGLNKSDNFGVIEDHLGRVWVANNEEGVFVYDGSQVKHLTTLDGLAANSTRILIEDKSKDVWVGSKNGLNKVSPDFSVKNYSLFFGESIKSLAIDSSNNLYVGTLSKGIWKKENGKDEFVRLFPEKVRNCFAINFDKNGDIIIGTNEGCFFKNNGTFQLLNKGIKNAYIGNIAIDRNGKIWVGTDRSISRWDGDYFTNYDINDGLVSDLVYILFSDREGFLWCGTNKGLDRISINSNSEIAKIKHYGFEEGFKGVEVNAKGFFENSSGDLYFSTVEGLHKYSSKYDYNYSYNTPVYINELKLFLENIDSRKLQGATKNWFGIPKNIILEPEENHITFDFFAVDYLNPNGINYTYFLEGFDKQWSPPTKSRYAVYSNLPPGNYTFNVKQYGNEFSQIATINFRIKRPPPPFYKSTWFLLACLIVFALLIYYFTEYRTAQLRNQQVFLEAKIHERTLEIQESEKEKTILLQEVHHRVKNNLQIIISLFRLQTHFTDNEEAIALFKNSQNRIRSMSKIHEKLYETKDLSKVEIKSYIEELVNDLVTSYDISNKVIVNSKIQNCFINLNELTPLALIINEIITNSMKYGFENVENPTISIQLTQSVIGDTFLGIEDNGIGFDKSIWDDHQTMGIELIKTLTDQLDGEIKLDLSSGSPKYSLKFKATL